MKTSLRQSETNYQPYEQPRFNRHDDTIATALTGGFWPKLTPGLNGRLGPGCVTFNNKFDSQIRNENRVPT